MKKFIEVTAGNGRHLININSISHVREKKGGRCEITLLSSDENKDSHCLVIQESYEHIQKLLLKIEVSPTNPEL